MNENHCTKKELDDILDSFLVVVRNVLDMDKETIQECFGEELETGWEVIDDTDANFIMGCYEDWLKKKDAEEAANRREEIVDEAVHDFQKVIPMLIGEMKEIMRANGCELKAVKINFDDVINGKLETRVVYSPV